MRTSSSNTFRGIAKIGGGVSYLRLRGARLGHAQVGSKGCVRNIGFGIVCGQGGPVCFLFDRRLPNRHTGPIVGLAMKPGGQWLKVKEIALNQ